MRGQNAVADVLVRTSVRLPRTALKAAKKVAENVGGAGGGLVGRSDVIRHALIYGLRAFLDDPKQLVDAAKIKLPE